MSKDIKLTNWQVPRDPKMAGLDALKIAAEKNPIDLSKYENVGSVEHHDSVESVAAKMIAKQEAARGVKIDATETPGTKVNLNGINDDRAERKFWTPGQKVEGPTAPRGSGENE